MDLGKYFSDLIAVHDMGNATEHSYRAVLQGLFGQIAKDIKAQNEPERLRNVGAPDFSFHRGDVIMGHAEAKILGADLKGLKGREKDQLERYRKALPNLIYTDGLLFLFYRDGVLQQEVRIGQHLLGWQAMPENFAALEHALTEFAVQTPVTITSPEVLATLMAGKAALIKDILGRSLVADKDAKTELTDQFHAFRDQLIHDISVEDFAGMYAETIAYGMFAARLHDDVDPNLPFTRYKAMDLLPKSNPFLRNLFGYIAGPNLDDRIRWIIDALAKVFQACDVASLMRGFGRMTGRDDPFLHFYETFLAAFDPSKRKAKGVWYTPQPVVNFIVRAVDEVLQTEFGLPLGLADTSKVTIDWGTGQTHNGKAETIKKQVHRVQILDPATGTGTFLAEVIRQIAPRIQGIAPGQWNGYVEQELIPRLHGFELLMASYAMCHMKLDMILRELNYVPTGTPPRLSVYLTNSLEEGQPANQTLPFAQWLSNEVKDANTVKRDMPIMCVIGNPPYLGEGGVSEGWMGELMQAYKKEPGGVERLNERNPKWLNDLYVKFIRMSESLIEKNGEGVLAFITNHGYIDNPTFRGMRWHLMKTFDKIYVLDLHGNSKKKEVAPDGGNDVNVFDIQQGVSIFVGVKRSGLSESLAKVMHGELWGARAEKYAWLTDAGNFGIAALTKIEVRAPQYFFKSWDFETDKQWAQGFSLGTLMPINSNGIVTGDDRTLIASDVETLRDQIERKFKNFNEGFLERLNYRQFEKSVIYNDPTKIERGRQSVMRHYSSGPQIGLLVSKQVRDSKFAHVFVTEMPSEAIFLSGTTASNAMNAPLYLYPTEQDLDQTRRVNFDPKLHRALIAKATHPDHGEPTPEDIFDYIYAVLHCPAYRATYAEFLKIDFPRIPWPKTAQAFWALVPQGRTLRRLHLMDAAAIGPTPYLFQGNGDNVVDQPEYRDGAVWINRTQGFAAVPPVSWDFYIGGYQPAQKWLKDRKGRTLGFADIQHYQRIIKILSETARIMGEITMDLT